MNFEIRPATVEDTEKIVQFNIAMALESENLRIEGEKVRLGVHKSLSNPLMGRYYLAHRGDDILGQIRVTLEWSDWNNASYWWIQNVYVIPSERKQGVYSALHNYVKALAREAGACGLQLYVDEQNESAQAVYKNLNMAQSHYLIFEQREDSPEKQKNAPDRTG